MGPRQGKKTQSEIRKGHDTKKKCFPDVCGLSVINCYLFARCFALFDCLLVYELNRMNCVNVFAWEKTFTAFLGILIKASHSPQSNLPPLHLSDTSINPSYFLSSTHALKAQACKYLSSHKHLHKARLRKFINQKMKFILWLYDPWKLNSLFSSTTASSSAFEINIEGLVVYVQSWVMTASPPWALHIDVV